MQYLTHMNDRRRRAQLDIDRNNKQFEQVLKEIASFLPTTQDPEDNTRALLGEMGNFGRFAKDLTNLGTAIDILQKEVRATDDRELVPSYGSTHSYWPFTRRSNFIGAYGHTTHSFWRCLLPYTYQSPLSLWVLLFRPQWLLDWLKPVFSRNERYRVPYIFNAQSKQWSISQ